MTRKAGKEREKQEKIRNAKEEVSTSTEVAEYDAETEWTEDQLESELAEGWIEKGKWWKSLKSQRRKGRKRREDLRVKLIKKR